MKKNNLRQYVSGFFGAWDLLFDLTLPKGLKSVFCDAAKADSDPQFVFRAFPFVGLALGLFIYLSVKIMGLFAGNLAVALVSSILIISFLELLSSGRGLAVFASFIEKRMGGLPGWKALAEVDDNLNAGRNTVGTMALFAIFLFRVLCMAALVFYGQAFWIMPVLVCGYAVQANLAAVETDDSEAILDGGEKNITILWIIAFVLSVVSGVCHPIHAIALFLIALAYVYFLSDYCVRTTGVVTGRIISFAGFVFEVIGLLAGVIFLTKI